MISSLQQTSYFWAATLLLGVNCAVHLLYWSKQKEIKSLIETPYMCFSHWCINIMEQKRLFILMRHFCVLAWRQKWKTLRGSNLKVIKLCHNYTDYFLGIICAGCIGGGVIYQRVVPHSYLSLFMQEQTSSALEIQISFGSEGPILRMC